MGHAHRSALVTGIGMVLLAAINYRTEKLLAGSASLSGRRSAPYLSRRRRSQQGYPLSGCRTYDCASATRACPSSPPASQGFHVDAQAEDSELYSILACGGVYPFIARRTKPD